MHIVYMKLNYFLANVEFCRLLITCANSLDPDQDQIGFLIFSSLENVYIDKKKITQRAKS